MHVFIVEDSPPVRQRLAEMVKSVPGTSLVGEASNAQDAIREILATRPDLVLCDLSLAGGNGFDVLRAVRSQAPGIDFYVLSSFASEPYRQLAERLGARDFFDKSHEFDRVLEMIAERAARKT